MNTLKFDILIAGYFLISTTNIANAQSPEIEWQNSIGGTLEEGFSNILQLDDGGYIGSGSTESGISGDKTIPSFGQWDVWIVRLDEFGSILWQKVYGGSLDDYGGTIIPTADGGFLLANTSDSNISGNKSQNSKGGDDFWVIKLDSVGNIQWDKTIGGSGFELLRAVCQTVDGGYVIGGTSQSNISGDKSEPAIGDSDIWIVKLNEFGEIVWQNTIGGESWETVYSIKQASDSGFICAATSGSNSSADKSENRIGGNDYWLIKLNNAGVIEWENTIGGTNSDVLNNVTQTDDGGYLLGGYSKSGAIYDKTENNKGEYGTSDYWIVKVNSIGFLEWQNTIGGDDEDILYDLYLTDENDILLCGVSYSEISDDKSEAAFAWGDYWIVKLDSLSNIIWDRTIGGNSYDYPDNIVKTSDGGIIIGGGSNSGISGNKTDPTVGYWDYWIVKLGCDAGIEICNSLDDNCNGLIDDDISEAISISTSDPTSFCQGDAALLNASFTGLNVQWLRNGSIIPGATTPTYNATTKGNYTATTTSLCDTATSAPIFITVNKNPSALIIADGPVSFCAGGSVLLSANTGAGLSYQWYKNASLIDGATTINYLATTAGIYKCKVTKTATGCNKMSAAITVTVPCKEGEQLLEDSKSNMEYFVISPNPSHDIINIIFYTNQNDSSYNMPNLFLITSITGQYIEKHTLNNNTKLEVQVADYPSGVYLGILITSEGSVVQKFIIE